MKNLKNKKIIYPLAIFVIIFAVLILSSNNSNNKEPVVNQPPKEESSLVEEKNKFEITLKVLDKVYKTKVSEGDNLYQVMNDLQEENKDFSFSYKEYSGLGIYINEINGIKEEKGKYWLYDINGKEASVGVLKYIPKPLDVISWRRGNL